MLSASCSNRFNSRFPQTQSLIPHPRTNFSQQGLYHQVDLRFQTGAKRNEGMTSHPRIRAGICRCTAGGTTAGSWLHMWRRWCSCLGEPSRHLPHTGRTRRSIPESKRTGGKRESDTASCFQIFKFFLTLITEASSL